MDASILSAEYTLARDLILEDTDIMELELFLMREYRKMIISGIHVQFCDDDPYHDHAAMVQDVLQNRQLKVFSGGTSSPILSDRHNLIFRAVHDWHHVKCGGDFSLSGEIATFKYVASLLLNFNLVKLMFSEIVLQAATAIHTGSFPDQRIVDSNMASLFV